MGSEFVKIYLMHIMTKQTNTNNIEKHALNYVNINGHDIFDSSQLFISLYRFKFDNVMNFQNTRLFTSFKQTMKIHISPRAAKYCFFFCFSS